MMGLPHRTSPLPGLLTVLILGLMLPASMAVGQIVYNWDKQLYGTLGGKRQLLYNDAIRFGKMSFADLDGDGDRDLLVGSADGGIRYFENVGQPGKPVLELRQEHLMAVYPGKGQKGPNRTLRPIKTNGHAAPALVDIDSDGDQDLFVGTRDGNLLFFRNVGTPLLPTMELVTNSFVSGQFGTYLVPHFADVNRDRAPDLILGNFEGQVFLLINQGTKRRAVFCVEFPLADALPDEEPPCSPAPRSLTRIAPENYAVPALTDWDRDGDLDLFIGKGDGTLDYYENQGSAYAGNWRLRQPRFLAIDDGGNAAPAFLDITADGIPDLLVGGSTNNIQVYTSGNTGKFLDVWKQTGNFLKIARLGLGREGLVPAFGDLDGDKDADLIIGTKTGELIWLENTGKPTEPAWRVRSENIIPGFRRPFSAPVLWDVDGDGDLDLIVGGRDGRLALIQNTGSAKKPAWRLKSSTYAGIDVGRKSIPLIFDGDGDGIQDLLVGNSQGFIIFFRNQGSPAQPKLVLTSTRFAGISVPKDAAPTSFDWNNDKRPDLLVGAGNGRIVLAINGGPGADPAKGLVWEVSNKFWENIQTRGNNIPRMVDLNGDKRPDLVVADANGNFKVWLNGGIMNIPPPVASAGLVQQSDGSGVTGGVTTAAGGTPPSLSTALLGRSSGTGGDRLFSSDSDEQPEADASPAAPVVEQTGPIPPQFSLASKIYGGLKFNGRSAPTFGDVDGDGDLDLIVGTGRGDLVYYRNTGTKNSAKWTKVTDHFMGFDSGRYPSPLLVDITGDGKVDLLVGTESGKVLIYENKGSGDPPLQLVDGALAKISVRRNAAPALLQPAGDGGFLLLAGDLSGQIRSYTGTGKAQSLNFKLSSRRFQGIDVGVSATPYFGDLNRDGSLELLIGSDQGLVHYYQQNPPGSGKGWKLGKDFLSSLPFPAGTTPRLADIDGDGDQDLFLGSEKGTLYFYRNNAIGGSGAASQ